MNRLLSQFHDSPKLNAVQEAFFKQLNEVELVFEQLRRLVEEALGLQLDTLGKLVGQKRKGMSDDDFKLWIHARILLNQSRGTASDLESLLNVLTGQSVTLVEHNDVAFTVQLEEPCPFDPQQVFEIIRQAKPLGVPARLWLAPHNPVFRFDFPFQDTHWSELIS